MIWNFTKSEFQYRKNFIYYRSHMIVKYVFESNGIPSFNIITYMIVIICQMLLFIFKSSSLQHASSLAFPQQQVLVPPLVESLLPLEFPLHHHSQLQ